MWVRMVVCHNIKCTLKCMSPVTDWSLSQLPEVTNVSCFLWLSTKKKIKESGEESGYPCGPLWLTVLALNTAASTQLLFKTSGTNKPIRKKKLDQREDGPKENKAASFSWTWGVAPSRAVRKNSVILKQESCYDTGGPRIKIWIWKSV